MIIGNITKQILECEDRANEIWSTRKKRSTIHEDRLREKIRNIHLIEESLFFRLWEEAYDEVEEIDSYENENFPKRLVFCNGDFHFITDTNYDLLYGVKCGC